LNKLLVEHNFPSMAIYGGLSQDERLDRYNKFKEYKGKKTMNEMLIHAMQ